MFISTKKFIYSSAKKNKHNSPLLFQMISFLRLLIVDLWKVFSSFLNQFDICRLHHRIGFQTAFSREDKIIKIYLD